MSKNRTETRKIELVETGNIALALDRCKYTDSAARALYHAMLMTGAAYFNPSKMEAIRKALELP